MMDTLTSKYKKILKDLEKHIKNEQHLEYIKAQMSNLFMIFFHEIDTLKENYEEKVQSILATQKGFEEKISKIETTLANISKEIYIDDDTDFEIECPYCNYNFILETSELKPEIQCPNCKNVIELDWDNEDVTVAESNSQQNEQQNQENSAQQKDEDDM